MKTRVAFGLVAMALAASVVTTPAAISDPVKTASGQLAGVTLASGVRVFKGIPFGAPPVGDLRWKEPQPVAKWDGVRKADTFGNVCVQPSQPNRLPNKNVSTDLPDSPKTSEDCLYLNLWTSANRANDRQPVMVWIFGGAYSEGAGSSPHNDGEALARKGVVLVTFNYRLGAFGFFSHPELTKESGRNASGNQALADTIAVLRWVKENVAAFGGDPNNVTIFGESAGSAMAGGLLGSPVAKGMFHRAILESGNWMGLSMNTMAKREAAERPLPPRGRGRGANAGDAPAPPPAPTEFPPLAELRARSTEEVVKTLGGRGMIIDGYIIPEDVTIAAAQGRLNPVDVIAGFNKDEHTSLGGNVAFRDNMAYIMRLTAERITAQGKRAYWYTFTHEPPVDLTQQGVRDFKATHAAEIAYAFNNLHAPGVYPDMRSPKLAMASAKDRAMAEMMSSYWVNFAKNGDPNGRGLPNWPRFKDRNAPPHVLGEIKEYPSNEVLGAYDAQYAKILATLGVTQK
jgi:para-nitrobenzyl esterase